MPRYKGRFVSTDALEQLTGGAADLVIPVDSGQSENESSISGGDGHMHDVGIHLLVAAAVFAVIMIFFILPEFSYRPTERIRLEELDPDALILVPNRVVALNTSVRRTNRITGDRSVVKSQDALQDDIVLAPRRAVQGDFTLMTQGDAVPIYAELLDQVGWMRRSDCARRSEELGYLVAC